MSNSRLVRLDYVLHALDHVLSWQEKRDFIAVLEAIEDREKRKEEIKDGHEGIDKKRGPVY